VELILALVCDDARSNEEGKLDIHGAFNDLYAPGFPAKQDHLTLVLVIEWDREDAGRFQFSVDLKDQNGNPSLSVTGHTDVDLRPDDKPPARTRLLLPLDEVIFPIPGPYRFTVKVKGRELNGPTVHLTRTEAPTEPGDGPEPQSSDSVGAIPQA
jgi:hypothetical protein